MILDRPDHILQTIYQDDVAELNAVAIDKHTGKIAVHGGGAVHIYKPYGVDWGLPKVSHPLAFFRCRLTLAVVSAIRDSAQERGKLLASVVLESLRRAFNSHYTTEFISNMGKRSIDMEPQSFQSRFFGKLLP